MYVSEVGPTCSFGYSVTYDVTAALLVNSESEYDRPLWLEALFKQFLDSRPRHHQVQVRK